MTRTGTEPKNLGVVRIAISMLLFACRGGGGDAGPPCSAVAARFLEIASHELANAKVENATARAVADQLPAMRDALSAACTDGSWSAAPRACLVHANAPDGFAACRRLLTDEQRRDLDRATGGAPAIP